MDYARDVSELCTKIFEGASGPVVAFVPALFLVRVIYASITGSGDEIKATLKGTVLFFILLHSFRLILDVLFAIPEAFLPSARVPDRADLNGAIENFTAAKDIPFLVQYVVESLIALLYWAAAFLHVLFMALMSALAPIVFLLSCLLGIGLGLRLFFGLLVLASAWPVMWYGFDFFLKWADQSVHDTFGKAAIELIVTTLKGIGPIGVAYLSMNSGPGRALSAGAAQMAAGIGLGRAGAGLAAGGLRGFATSVRKFTPNPSQDHSSETSGRGDGGTRSRVSQGLEHNRTQDGETREEGRLNSSRPQVGHHRDSQQAASHERLAQAEAGDRASGQPPAHGSAGLSEPANHASSHLSLSGPGFRSRPGSTTAPPSSHRSFVAPSAEPRSRSQSQTLDHGGSSPADRGGFSKADALPARTTSSRITSPKPAFAERRNPFLPDKSTLSHSLQDHLVQDDHTPLMGH